MLGKKMEDRPIIVGGGIAGSFLASELVKNGIRPIVIEEHSEIGRPFKCGGIVSDRIRDVAKFPRRLILRVVEKAIANFPDESRVIIKGFERGYVLDRVEFDKHFYKEAEKGGADFFLNESFKNFWRNGDRLIIETNKRRITTSFLIGADGAASKIRRRLGIDHRCIMAIQVRGELKHDEKCVEVFFDRKMSSGFFGWIIPETKNISRVGIGDWKNPKEKINLFLRKVGVQKIIDKQAGLIPIGYPKKTCWDNIILVGDAAGQIKASTGGGIVTGMLCAKEASNSIIRAYNQRDFSQRFLQENYEKKWRKEIGKHLEICYILATALENLDNSDLAEFGELVRRPEIMSEIAKHGDIDFYTNMMVKIMKKPSAMVFMIEMAFKHPEFLKQILRALKSTLFAH